MKNFAQRLIFDDQISDLCKKTNRNIHGLATITPFMNLSKRCLLMNTFLLQNSFIALSYGCSIVEKTITKLTDSKNVVCE